MVGFAVGLGVIWAFVYLARESAAAIILAWIAVFFTLAGFIMFPVFIWYMILIIIACVLLTVFVIALPYIVAFLIGVAFVYFAIISLGTFLEHVTK
jgi:hypothetical protein